MSDPLNLIKAVLPELTGGIQKDSEQVIKTVSEMIHGKSVEIEREPVSKPHVFDIPELTMGTKPLSDYMPPPSPIKEIVDIGTGLPDLIELVTKPYSFEDITKLPVGSVVIQLENRLNTLVVTPYIVNRHDDLSEFFKSKHLNFSPLVKLDKQTSFVILSIADSSKSMKENALIGKQKLDILAGLLGLSFADGSYYVPEVDSSGVESGLILGKPITEQNSKEVLNLPTGSVLFTETEGNVFGSQMAIIGDNKELFFVNSNGLISKHPLSTTNIMKMGIVVMWIGKVTSDTFEQIKTGRRAARKTYRHMQDEFFDTYLPRLLRKNPPRTKQRQWNLLVNPLTPALKKHYMAV